MKGAAKLDGRSARRRHTGTGIGDTSQLTWAAMRKAYENGEPLSDVAKRFGVLYSAARSEALRRPDPWPQSAEARHAWELRHGIRREAPVRTVTPARQAASDRKRAHANARRLRWVRERIAGLEKALPVAIAECRKQLLAFCALPSSEVTRDACEVPDRALGDLRYQVIERLEYFRADAAALAAELGRAEGVIELFPQGRAK